MENEYTTIAISEFKATCLKILKQVQRTGQQIVVTKRGEPMALISPPPSRPSTPSWLGSFQSHGRIKGDIVSPAAAESEWEALS